MLERTGCNASQGGVSKYSSPRTDQRNYSTQVYLGELLGLLGLPIRAQVTQSASPKSHNSMGADS